MSAVTEDAPAVRRRSPQPSATLIAAVVVAVASVAVVAVDAGWIIGLVVMLLAVAVTVWAALSAVRRESVFLAPLAIALVAFLNPAVLVGIGAHITDRAGLVTVTLDRGIVVWSKYPGIAGWQVPDDLVEVSPVAIGQTVQAAMRAPVDAMSDAFAWTWAIGEGGSGVSSIVNGYGGASSFVRVDSSWTTSDLDGSTEQRDALVRETSATALALGAVDVTDVSGDVAVGDGVREWSDGAGGVLRLAVEGNDIEFAYVGGPYLASSLAEFELGMSGYEGLTLPAPLVEPNLP